MKSIINKSFLSVTLVTTVLGNYSAYASPVRVVASQQSEAQNVDVNISDKSMHDLEVASAKIFLKLELLKLKNPELGTNFLKIKNIGESLSVGGYGLVPSSEAIYIFTTADSVASTLPDSWAMLTGPAMIGSAFAAIPVTVIGISVNVGASHLQSLTDESKSDLTKIVDEYSDVLSLNAGQKQKLFDAIVEKVAKVNADTYGKAKVDIFQVLLECNILDSDEKKIILDLEYLKNSKKLEENKLILQASKKEILEQRLDLLKVIQMNILDEVKTNPATAAVLSPINSNINVLISYIQSLLV